ncbi:MAG: alpha/beta hydrolase [Candidatus Eremiobacteraeota bacterium]|nr:alpha/beta hydrolase [Candidatus Eremiobacteraeota bacterium]MBV8722628.1 alpha/beta hydrolase [Candidatus Eremiobacteraeota bacterium]
MHRLKLVLAVAWAVAVVACSSKSIAPLPPGPSFENVAPRLARGTIFSLKRVAVFTKAQLSGKNVPGTLGYAEQVVTQLGGAPKCDAALYSMTYETIGISGEPALASAAFFVPSGCKGPYLLIGYGQGTNVVKAQKITEPTGRNIEPQLQSAIWASHGYAMAATDYLGLGYSTYPFEPYLVVTAEASAVIDSMRAARNAAKTLHVRLSGDVFLTGYSQGGQTSLGTQKIVEAQNAAEFHVIASNPSSGPYALSRTLLDGLRHPGQNAPVLATFVLTAYNKTYANVYTDPTAVFRQPYAKWATNLLPVADYAQAAQLAGKLLPTSVYELLQPSFLKRFGSDASSPARRDIAANDLLDGWTPKAPVYFCGGDRDPQVEFKNSELAYAYFKARGATVNLFDVNPYVPKSIPLSQYHDAVLVLCHTLERAKILDARTAAARTGTWPTSLPGSFGPLTYPSSLP